MNSVCVFGKEGFFEVGVFFFRGVRFWFVVSNECRSSIFFFLFFLSRSLALSSFDLTEKVLVAILLQGVHLRAQRRAGAGGHRGRAPAVADGRVPRSRAGRGAMQGSTVAEVAAAPLAAQRDPPEVRGEPGEARAAAGRADRRALHS